MGSARNQTIDAFRGVAILLVMAFHYGVEALGVSKTSLLGRVGPLGVELFFVISGMVITMTVLRSSGPGDFIVKRFIRIYPAFIFAATVTFLLLYVHHPVGLNVSPLDYVLSLTLLSDRLGHRLVDGAYWSLLIEFQFYAAVAIAYAALRRNFWIGVLVVLTVGGGLHPFSKAIAAVVFSSYSTFFLIGMAAWIGSAEKRPVAAIWLLLGAAVTYIACPQRDFITPIMPIVAIFLAMFLSGRSFPLAPLAWIGRISFSLYLIHQNLGLTLIADLERLGIPAWLCACVTAAVCILAAWAMFNWIEQPLQRLLLARWRAIRSWSAGLSSAPRPLDATQP